MSLHFRCPSPRCGKGIKASSKYAGMVVNCPQCGQPMQVPPVIVQAVPAQPVAPPTARLAPPLAPPPTARPTQPIQEMHQPTTPAERVEREYSYKAGLGILLITNIVLVVLAAAAFYGQKEKIPINIPKLKLNLTGTQAQAVWWFIVIGFGLLEMVLAAPGLLSRLFGSKRLSITPTGILVPRFWRGGQRLIRYRDISKMLVGKLTHHEGYNDYLIEVIHSGRKQVILAYNMRSLPEFIELCSLLTHRTGITITRRSEWVNGVVGLIDGQIRQWSDGMSVGG